MPGKIILILMTLSSSALAQSVIVGSGSQEQIGAGSQVILSPAGLDVQSGGVLQLAGSGNTSANQGVLTSGVPAGVVLNVLSGGAVDFKFGRLESILTVIVASGAKVTRIHDAVFTDLAGLNPGATAWIDISSLGANDRSNLPFSFNRVTFQDPQGTPTRFNIKSSGNTPLLRCLGNSTAHGNRWGNSFDQDTSNVILWHTGQVSRTSPAGTFDTIEDGLKDAATTASSTFTVNLGPLGFIDDVADFSTLPGNVASATGPVVKNACLAPMTGKTVFDGDGDTTRRGKIINCIVARGTVEETTAENCTFFDPGAAVITVNNIAGTNCLIENGFSGTGNNLTTSITTVNLGFFMFADAYNFHLLSPGGDAAIDEGSALATTTDIDGESRGIDGKPGGTGTWDIGADEYAVPTVTTSNHTTFDTTPLIQVSGINGRTVAFFRNNTYIGSAVVSGGVASLSDPAAQFDGVYYYTAAYDMGGGMYGPISTTTAWITIDTVPPAPPTNIRVSIYNACVDVEWDLSPTPGVIGYKIYRKTGAGGTWTLLNPSGVVTGTKYRDTPLTNGTTYFYHVSAVDNALPQ